jgi:hypothetical protein
MALIQDVLTRERASLYSTVLFVLVAITIFAAPAFPVPAHRIVYGSLFTLMILAASLAVERGRRAIFRFALVSIAFLWISDLLDLEVLLAASRAVILLFFIAIVFGLISQIARRTHVTTRVIMESITGYLLLGIVFSLLVNVLTTLDPHAFGFPSGGPGTDQPVPRQSDFSYYAFVTYTTLGYGEIVPLTRPARSFAILMAVTGPIYLTVIIAMLVGKFVSSAHDPGERKQR